MPVNIHGIIMCLSCNCAYFEVTIADKGSKQEWWDLVLPKETFYLIYLPKNTDKLEDCEINVLDEVPNGNDAERSNKDRRITKIV